MLKIEIDGNQTEVQNGSTVMDAANSLGIYIPHFCYHKKLSIAANCRMCLVQVEKAPKPLPACATPVTDGMKVFTHSEYAVQAQKGVMEFLLINHPLDCPICDQGGECQLQDLAVGYGGSGSRYQEEKRVVFHKNVGPLISMEEMTRCIHCTRCVRFGQEIAGVMELGMAGRGEHAEIMSFVGRTVDSELSGNMIDLCPVGALTSKPFRYTARTWELTRKQSVSPHCGLGSNLTIQVKQNRVMRTLPRENEDINECWLSDKDRFAYEGLNTEDRLTRPMLKQGGQWQEVDWQVALEYVATGLNQIKAEHGTQAIGALSSPHATLEELYLLQKLVKGLGSGNVDFRLRQNDFRADGKLVGAPWLGCSVAELSKLDRVLVVGSFLRKDHPLIANRFRQSAKKGTQINLVHATDDDLLMPIANKVIVAPSQFAAMLVQILKALAEQKGVAVPVEAASANVSEFAKAIAASLASGQNAGVFLGNFAQQHAQAADLHALAQKIAELSGAKFGFLGEAANSVGGYIAGATPAQGGLNAAAMLAGNAPLKAVFLLHAEPELDSANPASALATLKRADMVVALATHKHHATEYADVLLPIAPFTETAGSFISTEGRLQSFTGVVRPFGEARPAWKVLRVLGNLTGLDGFDFDSAEEVRGAIIKSADVASKLGNGLNGFTLSAVVAESGIERIAEVPIYFADGIARRAYSLQKTSDAKPPKAVLGTALAAKLGVQPGDRVRMKQGEGEAVLVAAVDARLPVDCVRVALAHVTTAGLGAATAPVVLERIAAERAA